MLNIKKIYGLFLKFLTNCFDINFAKKFDTWIRFHRVLDLSNPRTLADKVSYLELHNESKLVSLCTDKYEVRKYISNKGFDEIIIPIVGGPWIHFDEIDFNLLPGRFVMKATHGCKMNYIVRDKRFLDKEKCRKEINRWLSTTYGTYSIEPHYTGIEHRIYAEEFLGDAEGLTDYKFHCINGVPQFVITVTDRKVDGDKSMIATIDLFDMNWHPIYEVVGANHEKAGDGDIKKPEKFDEMVYIASKLSEDFKFVRVDLYEVDGKVMFGELTFSPACCIFPYLSKKFLLEMGEKLVL